MVAGVRRRLALLYAAIFAATLLLLGPVLYLSFARQLVEASDATLRLAAQREAARLGGRRMTRRSMRPSNAGLAAQRAFVADASQELGTPLTLIRTNAEV